jgi:hypothetical protein
MCGSKNNSKRITKMKKDNLEAKSILVSASSVQAKNILDGKQTLFLRRSVPKDFVGWVYMYVTKSGLYLCEQQDGRYFLTHSKEISHWGLNGKVVAKWWHNRHIFYTPISLRNAGLTEFYYLVSTDEKNALCLDDDEINAYGKGKNLCAWSIKKLRVFKKHMELREFYRIDTADFSEKWMFEVNKAPSSWRYIWGENK